MSERSKTNISKTGNDMRRMNYISLLSVISCIAVVFLHANNCYWTFSTERYWKTANLIECLFYFPVPCFFMISGATLINYRERYSLKEYFAKRINRTVIPFLAWSFVGLGYSYFWKKTVSSDRLTVKGIFNGIVGTEYVTIYWFFISLFIVYLSIPLLAYVEKEKRKEIFTFIAVVAFICNLFVPFFIKTIFTDVKWPFTLNIASGYVLYAIIGYLINEYEVSKKVRIALYVSSIAGFLIHLLGTYYASMDAGYIDQTYKGGMPCMMYTVGIFVWMKYNGGKLLKSKIVSKIVDFLKEYTFGIYLVHWYIKDIMVSDIGIDERSIVFRLLGPFVIIAISVLILFVIKRIPLLRRTVG